MKRCLRFVQVGDGILKTKLSLMILCLAACEMESADVDPPIYNNGCGEYGALKTIASADFHKPDVSPLNPPSNIEGSFEFNKCFENTKLTAQFIRDHVDRFGDHFDKNSKVLYISSFDGWSAHSVLRLGEYIYDPKFDQGPTAEEVIPKLYQEYFLGRVYYDDAKITEIPVFEYAEDYGNTVDGIYRNSFYYGAALDLFIRNVGLEILPASAKARSLHTYNTKCFRNYLSQTN